MRNAKPVFTRAMAGGEQAAHAREPRTTVGRPAAALRLAASFALAAGLLLTSGAAIARGDDAQQGPVVTETSAQPTTQPTAQPTTMPATDGPLITNGLNADGTVSLTAGQSVVLTTRAPYHRVSIASTDVADYHAVSPTQILLTGKKAGVTQLVVWDDADRSQVMEVMINPNLRALQDQLKHLFPTTKIDVSNASGNIVLRGRVANLETATRISQVATPYGTHVLNFLEVSGGEQVTLQVRFAEVSRGVTQNLGFNAFATDGRFKAGINNGPGDSPIGGLISNGAAAGGSTGTGTTIPPVPLFGSGQIGNTAFEFFINALRQNNLLRVLAEPNLTVISGKEANFIAGGEFPIPVPQSSGSGGTAITVQFKQYGVQLRFTPTVLGDGRIRLEASPTVSDLDYTQSVSFNGFVIPSLTTRTVTTTVELNEGQTLALAGLLNDRVTANKSVTPLLGDLPILGALFRSVNYQRNETELVVLVTPRIVSAMNPGQVPPFPGQNWRYPSEAQLFLNSDLGGPAPDTMHAPTMHAPPMFHGRYGFSPAEPTAR